MAARSPRVSTSVTASPCVHDLNTGCACRRRPCPDLELSAGHDIQVSKRLWLAEVALHGVRPGRLWHGCRAGLWLHAPAVLPGQVCGLNLILRPSHSSYSFLCGILIKRELLASESAGGGAVGCWPSALAGNGHAPALAYRHRLTVHLFKPRSRSGLLSFLSWVQRKPPQFLHSDFVCESEGREGALHAARTLHGCACPPVLYTVTTLTWMHSANGAQRSGVHVCAAQGASLRVVPAHWKRCVVTTVASGGIITVALNIVSKVRSPGWAPVKSVWCAAQRVPWTLHGRPRRAQ